MGKILTDTAAALKSFGGGGTDFRSFGIVTKSAQMR